MHDIYSSRKTTKLITCIIINPIFCRMAMIQVSLTYTCHQDRPKQSATHALIYITYKRWGQPYIKGGGIQTPHYLDTSFIYGWMAIVFMNIFLWPPNVPSWSHQPFLPSTQLPSPECDVSGSRSSSCSLLNIICLICSFF